MKKGFYFAIVILILAGFATLSCPDKKAHTTAIMEVVNEAVNEEMPPSESDLDNGLNVFFTSVGLKVAEYVLNQKMKVDNYFVCSIGIISTEDESRIVSVGVFNHIFTFSSDDLKKELKDLGV